MNLYEPLPSFQNISCHPGPAGLSFWTLDERPETTSLAIMPTPRKSFFDKALDLHVRHLLIAQAALQCAPVDLPSFTLHSNICECIAKTLRDLGLLPQEKPEPVENSGDNKAVT